VSPIDELRAQAPEVAAGWSPADAPDSWRLTAALFQAIAAHEGLLGWIALGIAATAVARTDPVGLADLGTGAGLGLQLDRYRYLLGKQASGPGAAALSLSCEVRGLREPPQSSLPPIAEPAGIDVSPVDVQDPPARSWLQACTPPEASALARLTAAIEVTRQHPVKLVTGDGVEALPGVLDSCPHRWSATASSTASSPCWAREPSTAAPTGAACSPAPTPPASGSNGSTRIPPEPPVPALLGERHLPLMPDRPYEQDERAQL
jgi:Uncharacterized protein conserved in bacteria (DUF2332)